jgi:hypothetical protein
VVALALCCRECSGAARCASSSATASAVTQLAVEKPELERMLERLKKQPLEL